MKVSELIAELKNFDRDAEVHFSYTASDYGRTVVAPVAENVDEGYVEHSTYHDMPKVVDGEDYDHDDERCKHVVIISAQ